MQMLLSIIVFLLLISCQQCVHLWSTKFPEIFATNNIITIQQNFSELQIRGLQGVLRYETLSQLSTVSKLKILSNHITEMEPGAICSSPKLQSLELNFAANPQAPTLTKRHFRQCHFQLRELFLRFDFDNNSELDIDALEDLRLEALSLQCYRIGKLRKNFLKLKTFYLIRLNLSNCHIYSIEIDVFNGMENLEELEISYNRNLTHLPRDLFQKTPKLKWLSLKYNRIRELKWNEFEGLWFLEDLNLTGNRLAYFDAEKIYRTMPRLKRLEMLKNIWPCKLKEVFATELSKKFNYSVNVIYANNDCKNYWEL